MKNMTMAQQAKHVRNWAAEHKNKWVEKVSEQGLIYRIIDVELKGNLWFVRIQPVRGPYLLIPFDQFQWKYEEVDRG